MEMHGTTIVAVSRAGQTAIAGDGQVTAETMVIKGSARKVQSLNDGKVVVGFAGAVADAMALLDKFRGYLEAHPSNLRRAAIELAKEWRTDRYLRQLQAQLIVADREVLLLISGTGDVLSPDEGVLAIGSGGGFALAAARALLAHTDLSAAEVAREALSVAADICIYTNHDLTVLTVGEAQTCPET